MTEAQRIMADLQRRRAGGQPAESAEPEREPVRRARIGVIEESGDDDPPKAGTETKKETKMEEKTEKTEKTEKVETKKPAKKKASAQGMGLPSGCCYNLVVVGGISLPGYALEKGERLVIAKMVPVKIEV